MNFAVSRLSSDCRADHGVWTSRARREGLLASRNWPFISLLVGSLGARALPTAASGCSRGAVPRNHLSALMDSTKSCAATYLSLVVRADNVMVESPEVFIYPWAIRSAYGCRKSRITAALGIGKVIS